MNIHEIYKLVCYQCAEIAASRTTGLIRLMQVVLESRDALRRLAASIDAAGDDPGREAEMLPYGARGGDHVQRRLADEALKDSATRPHSPRVPDSPCWLQDKNPTGL